MIDTLPQRVAIQPFSELFWQQLLHYQIAVLVPCYNEAITIGKVIRDFAEVLPHAQIYVYDNNSKDDTVQIARDAGATVRMEHMQGKGHVVRRMFRDIDADFYIMVDGDDTYDASKALEMLEVALVGPYDIVNCTRVTEERHAAYRMGHQLGNTVLTGMVKLLFGDRVQDMLSGYKVFSRRYVKSFPALSTGFEIETELTVHALELQMPIAHVQGAYRGRPTGSSSKLNTFRDGRRIGLVILDLFRQERPLLFFSFIAILLILLTIGVSVPLAVTYYHTGLVPRFPTLIVAAGLFVTAMISITCGLILDTVTRGRREAKMLQYLSLPAFRRR